MSWVQVADTPDGFNHGPVIGIKKKKKKRKKKKKKNR